MSWNPEIKNGGKLMRLTLISIFIALSPFVAMLILELIFDANESAGIGFLVVVTVPVSLIYFLYGVFHLYISRRDEVK